MKRIMLLLISSGLLLSCAGLEVPDVPICRPLQKIVYTHKDPFGIPVTDIRPNPLCVKSVGAPECGFCAYTLSNKQIYVGETKEHLLYGKTWSQMQDESLTLPTESMAAIKSSFINGCKQYGCNDNAVANWRVKFDSLLSQETKRAGIDAGAAGASSENKPK